MNIVSEKQELLGTVIEIKLDEQNSSFFSLCFNELQRIEKKYSRFLDTSELNKLNSNLNEWQQVDDEFLSILEKAVELQEKTEGNFDITLKQTLEDLGYDKDYSFKPKGAMNARSNDATPNKKNSINKDQEEKSRKIKKENNENKIIINKEEKKIKLSKQIEIGGFGKGFALDKLAELLNKNNIDHYYINAGGDIFAKQAESKDPWTILLEHPDDNTVAIGKINLNNKAIASSSPNRRKWKDKHHLINAKTKQPANDVKSIFILAGKGIDADAYATALFTAGFNTAIELSKKLNIECLIISNQNKMYKTDNFSIEFF